MPFIRPAICISSDQKRLTSSARYSITDFSKVKNGSKFWKDAITVNVTVMKAYSMIIEKTFNETLIIQTCRCNSSGQCQTCSSIMCSSNLLEVHILIPSLAFMNDHNYIYLYSWTCELPFVTIRYSTVTIPH